MCSLFREYETIDESHRPSLARWFEDRVSKCYSYTYELEYDSMHRVVLFKCEWYDVYVENVAIKVDAYGLTSVNVKQFLKTNELYVLASQVDQVYYVRDRMHQD